jgi:spore coat protein U-like protein
LGNFADLFKQEFDMNSNMTKLALAIGALAMAGGAMATDSGTGTMGVTGSIAPECAVGNAAAMTFGALTMLTTAGAQSAASNSSSGGTFSAICTNGTSTPKLRFTSLNTGTSDFRLVGADTTSHIVYTLAVSGGGAAITYGTDAAFAGLTADGTTKSLAIVGTIAAAAKNAKLVQAYTDTITVTSSYTP